MNMTTGFYLNIFSEDGSWDVFLIVSEGNNEPTAEEYATLHKIVETVIETNPGADKATMRSFIEDFIDATNLSCLEFGFEVFIK